MPPTNRSLAREDSSPELTPAVLQLASLVDLLATALDELTQEIQWHNREFSPRACPTHLPLTRLPLDPTAKDWHPQWGRPSDPTTADRSPPSPAQTDHPSRSVENLLHEVARVEQVAAILAIVFCGDELTDDEAHAWDAVLHWAYETFDAGCLRESIPEFFEESTSRSAASATHTPPSPDPPIVNQRQHELFADPDSEVDEAAAAPPSD